MQATIGNVGARWLRMSQVEYICYVAAFTTMSVSAMVAVDVGSQRTWTGRKCRLAKCCIQVAQCRCLPEKRVGLNLLDELERTEALATSGGLKCNGSAPAAGNPGVLPVGMGETDPR